MNTEKATRILTGFYIIPLFIMLLFNAGNSLLRTTYFELYSELETAKYRWDQPLLLLFLALLFLLVFLVLSGPLFGKMTLTRVIAFAVFFSGALSLFFVLLFRCTAVCDSEALNIIAKDFINGDYSSLLPGGYLYSYSFQIGMTALLELIYRIFGLESFLVFQILNVLSIMCILYLLLKITLLLTGDEDIVRFQAALSVGMLPLFLFSTFVYGDLIGWAFGIGAVYFLLRFLKEKKLRHFFISALLFLPGTVVKSNINILVTAAAIALILMAIRDKNPRILILVPVLILLSQCGVYAVKALYAHRAGLDSYPAGIPKIAWIAMGMQQADEGGYAPGWYNAYNWTVYERNGYDRAATSAECRENLKTSLNYFLHNKRYTLDFFYKKFTSAWNAPTFQSLITNEWGTRHARPLPGLGKYLIYGKGHDLLSGIMNVWHFLIFLLAPAGLIFFQKERSLEKDCYLLNIFGGFLFHMIWETQSRYILGYFVLLLPLSACALKKASGLLDLPGFFLKQKASKDLSLSVPGKKEGSPA
ncbi:MAG: glycosyltransferase family 39 protein [Lachnospiraceae bacterium]|nr:glycosyltransferase family 39 protein [Lachnospiraceae bacterium]